ncbi:hypothetical protein [Clostridium sp.]|uniref:hypothetical protein n=1 Tax=Clostridium sp. TaxID=1506 RepID=UPI0026387279|nr:hypothetical protein [Clostridium sp.]
MKSKNNLKEETMMIGREGEKFEIKKGSVVQLQNEDSWHGAVGTIEYIIDGVAHFFSPQFQEYGLYKIGIYNCTNVVPYTYESNIGRVIDFQNHTGSIPVVNTY